MNEAKEPDPSLIQGEAGDAVLVGARFGFCDGSLSVPVERHHQLVGQWFAIE